MAKIIGNTTSTPYPRPDWNQTDVNKADFIKNKPTLGDLSSKDIIEKTDLAEGVQASLNKADVAEQNAKNYVDEKLTAEATARTNADTALGERIDGVVTTHTTDKEALQESIDDTNEELAGARVEINEALDSKVIARPGYSLVADEEITRLSKVDNYNDGEVRGLISANTTAIETEKTRAEAAETNLQNQINTIMNNPDAEEAINSISEFTQWVKDHGDIAKGMQEAIDANTTSISSLTTSVASTYETKTAANSKLQSAKDYADGLAKNYDASGSAAAVEAKLNTHITSNETAFSNVQTSINSLDGRIDTLEGSAHTHGNAEELALIASGDKAKWDAVVADHLTSADKTDLNDAIAGEKSRAEGIESGLRTDVDGIKADYLTSTDKTTLSNAITSEQTRAEGIEGGLRTDVNAIKGDYLKSSDKTALQNQITSNTQAIAANTKAISDQATADAAAYETKTDANSKLTEAKAHATALDTAMSARVATLEAVDHTLYIAADAKVLTDAQKYADGKDTAIATAKQAGDNAQSDLNTFKTTVSTTYATKKDVESAIGNVHTHSNKDVIDGITATKVAAWDAAEQNAKDYADGKDATISAAKKAGDDAQEDLNTFKTTVSTTYATKSEVEDAIDNVHTHSNLDILNEINGDKIAAWDSAESNAMLYAEGLASNYATAAQGAKADSALQADDKTALENAIAGKVAQTAYNTKVKELADAIATKQNIITANTYDTYGSATTAETNAKKYTDDKINELVNGAPEALNTLDEIAAALKDKADIVDTLNDAIGKKADASSLATVATSGSYKDLTDTPSIPTKTSDLSNDSGFITTQYTLPTAGKNQLGGVKTTSSVTSTAGHSACPIIDGVPYYQDTVYGHPTTTAVTAGLYKIGKDNQGHVVIGDAFTIPAAYSHPTQTAYASGLYKITTNTLGHVTAATAVTKTDITGLGIPAQDTTYSNASTSKSGLMSAEDKTKLDSISGGANKITFEFANGVLSIIEH